MRIAAWPAYKNRKSNPYNWLLYTHLADQGVIVKEFSPVQLLLGRYDLWHLHWPEWGLSLSSPLSASAWCVTVLTLVLVARLHRTRVVWTVHNLRAHEGEHKNLEAVFWLLFTAQLDGFVALTESGLEQAVARFPKLRRRRGFVTPLGHYREVHPATLDRGEARTELGLPDNARVLALVGQIRAYKNVPGLLRVFRHLPDPDLALLIAGEPHSDEVKNAVLAAAGDDQRITLELRYLQEAQLQVYLRAADLIVLPFLDILNSASAVLALSFDRPILVPERGAMAELQAIAGTEWVRTYKGELTVPILQDGVEWAGQAPRPTICNLDALNWDGVARVTIAAYRAILGMPTGK